MQEIHIPSAYELIRRESIPDVQSEGYLLRHKKSGARVMLLDNEDDNKVFSIGFRTTPKDSTGVAHIMEHSTLCGSRKFPAKDPFVELAKGSMNTFLNAMTYPDKTIYPVASCNDRDFANLMDVYMDAVLYPNIYDRKEIFLQEGWHYQLEDADEPIVYNGVVYNEMKGAFSSPDDVVEREIFNSLFPDTIYHHESGGDPACIPDLKYEDYLEFHRTYYHPSNSYIYLYGKMDFEERLDWLDRAYLCEYTVKDVNSQISMQEPFEQMAQVQSCYPIGSEEEERNNTYLTWNAVIGTSLDTRLSSAFAVLDYALLGMPGAPLKQALLDAGIGMDVLSSYDSGTLQPVFSVIAKNANDEDRDRFFSLIRETLEKIVREGVDQKALRAAINIMEFRFREADYGSYPKGLMYGIDVYDSWLYDDDAPFDYLRQLDDFSFLKEQIGTGYYEELIRKYFLENRHVSLLVVSPEKGMTARVEAETAGKLAAYKASLSDREIRLLIQETKALREYQETPSTPEELEKIPLLTREDLKKETEPFRNEVTGLEGACLVHHDYATNGIAYIKILLDASKVAQQDLPCFGILRNILGYVDTEHYTYTDLFNEINLNTGGISAGISTFVDPDRNDKMKLALGMQIRTLYDRIEYCFDMVGEILLTSKFDSDKRLLEILQKDVSRMRTRLSESGSGTAMSRSAAGFSPSIYVNDCISGVRYFDEIREIAEHFDEKKEELKARLCRLMNTLLSGTSLVVSYTGDKSRLEEIRERTGQLVSRIRACRQENGADKPAFAACPCASGTEDVADQAREALADYPAMFLSNVNEGILTPSKVQYVARTGNFKEAGFAYTGALKVLRTIMNFEYLWSQVRVVGGAYGCSGSFNRNGDTVWLSYRDPQLKRTMDVFEGIPEYLEQFQVGERDMTKYVIGTVSDMDIPLTPSAKGTRSFTALMSGVSFDQLQKERDQVLSASEEDIRSLASLARAVLAQNRFCVLGNEDRLREEGGMFDELREL